MTGGGPEGSAERKGRRHRGLPSPGGPEAPLLAPERPPCELWGVLNVTPDSFSDGGRYPDPGAAFDRAREMVAEGAAVIDVGGESSRPAGKVYGSGASSVSVGEERGRVEPVVRRIARELPVRVSIDTVKAEVARAAIAAGARVVNDVSCGASPDLLRVCGESDVELVLMHNRGRGEVSDPNIRYADVLGDVLAELKVAVERAVEAGVRPERIWIDPGIGFAKTSLQSARLLARTAELVRTGHRVLVGPSRKSFIAALAPDPDGSSPGPDERAGGTAAAVTVAVMGGAHAVRVHGVGLMRQVVRVAERLVTAGGAG